jgi:uncharacterized lipoprotein
MFCKARLSCVLVFGAVFLLAGCGSSSTTEESATQTTSAAATSGTASPQSPSGKVSANTASVSEIESALSAAGVSNPGRWAHEVEEYRPYPADDPNLQKLRDNLAKYNPGQETLEKIISALKP